jgi:adenylate kinase family enzyme
MCEIDGSMPGEAGVSKLLELALPTITNEMPTRAPRGCARVLLLGGPGSNAEAVGAALAATYGAKLISAIELLHGAALTGSRAAAKAMDAEQPLVAGDALLGPLVLARIKEEDVRTNGFVLVGYPASSSHAAFLRKNNVWVRDAVHLELSNAAAEAAVCRTRYDPVDGEIYHLDTSPPADSETAKRLVIHPQHEPAKVKQALKTWAGSKQQLLKAYASELRTEDAGRSQRQLVERLASCFLSL